MWDVVLFYVLLHYGYFKKWNYMASLEEKNVMITTSNLYQVQNSAWCPFKVFAV